MQASDYEKDERFEVAGVNFIQKAKSCGKPNCEKCPHRGYWYARVPSYFAKSANAAEVYLGREWTDADLRKKVAPLLDAEHGVKFVTALDRIVTQKQIAAETDLRAKLAEEMKRLEGNYKRDRHLLEVRDHNAVRLIKEAKERLVKLGKIVLSAR